MFAEKPVIIMMQDFVFSQVKVSLFFLSLPVLQSFRDDLATLCMWRLLPHIAPSGCCQYTSVGWEMTMLGPQHLCYHSEPHCEDIHH